MERYSVSAGENSAAGKGMSRAISAIVSLASLALGAYAISTLVIKMDIYYVAIAVVLLLAAMIFSKKFELGLLIYAFIAPFNRGGSPAVLGGAASYQAGLMPSQIGLLLLCGIWAISRFFKGSQESVKTRLDKPFIAFFGVCVASIISAYFIWDPAVRHYDKQLLFHISEVGMWALCALAFYLVANAGKRTEWLEALFWPVAVVGIYVAIFQFAGMDAPVRITRSEFIPAYAAIFATARLAFGKDKAITRFVVAAILAINVASVFVARDWVSGWLTALLGIMVVIFFKSKRAFFAAAAVGLVLLVVFPAGVNNVYDQSRQEGDLDRFTIWHDSAVMATRVNPVLGIGPGDYLTYARKYASVWYGDTTYTNAHSTFAQVIAELGLLGTIAIIWLAVAGIKTGMDAIKKSRQDKKWFSVGATAIFAAIVATSLVGDYLLPSRVNGAIWTFGTSVYPWLLLGAAVAIARIDEQKPELRVLETVLETEANPA